MKKFAIFGMLLAVALVGCTNKDQGENAPPADAPGEVKSATMLPAFSVATSEYPSWSTYVVAAKAGLINPAKGGEHGPMETKYGVDIVLEVKDYDPCIVAYGNGTVDAVCITNIDVLNSSMSRATTLIMPTSTSAGGDQGIAVGINNLEELKGTPVYGLDNSVSEYTHYRVIELAGLNHSDYPFENLDPGPAATALQSGSDTVKAICVWNPFARQTRNNNPNAKLIYSSESIRGEILDSVAIGNDVLKREGGEAFATCLCAIQYAVCEKMSDGKTADVTIAALKDDFAPALSVDDMKNYVLKETEFYSTPDAGVSVYGNPKLKDTMATVVKTCQAIGILTPDKQPTISFDGSEGSQLTFTTKYMEAAKQ